MSTPYQPRTGRPATGSSAGIADNPWRAATDSFGRILRRLFWLIILAMVVGGFLGAAANRFLPPVFKATAQLLIDPRGIHVFSNDLSTGQFDANAAINFVESQMGVLKSDRVLLRVVRAEKLANGAQPAEFGTEPTPAADPNVGATAEVPATGLEFAESRALAGLQKSVFVQRAERSFIVEITVANRSPQVAARLANAVVKAYIDEDAIERNAAARRLTTDLGSRLDGLRQALSKSETKVEAFRASKGLIGGRDKFVLEQRMTELTTALSAAQSREARARAKLEQLQSNPADMTAIGALDTDPSARKLVLLIDRQTAARTEVAQLAGSLLEGHPALLSARSKAGKIDKSINDTILQIQKGAGSELARTSAETAEFTRRLATLTTEFSKARQAEVELRALERDADGNRKILEAFETRSREANEFGQIDASNLRIVSPARAPNVQDSLRTVIMWGIIGSLIGAMLVMSGIALAAVFAPVAAVPAYEGAGRQPAP